jgi:hypothetical protein
MKMADLHIRVSSQGYLPMVCLPKIQSAALVLHNRRSLCAHKKLHSLLVQRHLFNRPPPISFSPLTLNRLHNLFRSVPVIM